MGRVSLFELGDGSEGLQKIRALRSVPPGMAGDGRRGKTFAAGLEQFEQLIGAGSSLPPTSAPILLFYALAQGGRSVLAAHRPQPWEAHGHGLRIEADRGEIGNTRVVPAGSGLFQAVAETSGSTPLDAEISLDELWGAIPNLGRAEGLGVGQTPRFVVDSGTAGQLVVRDERGSLMENSEGFLRHLEDFPQLAKAEVNHHMQSRWAVITLNFADVRAEADFLASLWSHSGQQYLIPGGRTPPSGLMLWWCLLQALSQLARYEPAAWTAALDVDRSRLAVPLEAAIERAIAVLPGLLLSALKGEPTPGEN